MKPEKQKVEEGTCILSKELELLARTFSGVKDVGTLMVPFKVKQIVLEILTGFSADEIKGIREKVEALFLSSDYEQDETVERYLDESSKEGGLDMDSRTAKRLSREIGDIIQIIRKLEKIEEETEDKNKIDFDLEIVKIRRYIFNFFDIETIDAFIIKRLDVAIKKRLKNEIDKEELEKILDRSIRKGGVGFDTRISRKIARRLELLILGKFK